MNKYKFSINDIVEWQENELEHFKVKGNVKNILDGLKKKNINPIIINVIKNGKGYVIPEHKTIKEREEYHLIDKEHETLCQINTTVHKIREQENRLIKSNGTKEFDNIENNIKFLKQSVQKKWLTLSNTTKEKFTDNDAHLLAELPLSKPKQEIDKKHNHIFKDYGYELFKYLMENYVRKNRGRISDISFFYWKMYNENELIHQRPEVFKKWLGKESIYKQSLGDKIKTLLQLEKQEDARNEQFKTSLDIIKQRYKFVP